MNFPNPASSKTPNKLWSTLSSGDNTTFQAYEIKNLIVPEIKNSNGIANERPDLKSELSFSKEFGNFETIAAYGPINISQDNNIFIGTSDGYLLHYSCEFQFSDKEELSSTKLINSVKVTNGRKIDRVVINKYKKRLIVLHESTVRFFDFRLLCIPEAQVIKGITSFSISEFQQPGLLVAARRRNILVYEIGEDIPTFRKEIKWADAILSIGCNSTTICIGDISGLSLLDIHTLQSTRLFKAHKNPHLNRPSITSIDDDEFLVTSPSGDYGAIGMFVSSMADAVRGTIEWSSFPCQVAFEFPFTIAWIKENTIEIHNIMTQKKVQTIRLNLSTPIISLAGDGELKYFVPELDVKLNTGSSEDYRASTMTCSVVLCTGSYACGFFLNSVLLQVDQVLEQKQSELAVLMADEAASMLSEQSPHYTRLARELNHIYQKCGLIYLGQTLLDDAFFMLHRGRLDPRILIGLLPELRDTGTIEEFIVSNNIKVDPGVLVKISELNSVSNIVRFALDNGIDRPSPDPAAIALTSNLNEKIKQFLLEAKARSSNGRDGFLTKDQLATIDTALGKICGQEDPEALLNLLRSNHYCNLESCLIFFNGLNIPYAESLIYQAQGKASNVFSIWIKMYEDSKGVPLETIASYLKEQSDPKLVQDVTLWLIPLHPRLAAQAIIALPESTFGKIDVPLLLDTLQKGPSILGLELLLEHIVVSCGSKEPSLHMRLAVTYLLGLTDQLGQMDHSFIVARSIRPKCTFIDFLATRTDNASRRRGKLIKLLIESPYYCPKKFAEHVENFNITLHFETAILNSKLGNHDLVLQSLIALQDFSSAEMYCLSGGTFGSEAICPSNGLFNDLLELYFLGEDEQLMTAQVESLLVNHGSHFKATEVLDKLPSHWPFEIFASFLISHLKELRRNRLNLQILKGLAISENIEVNACLASIRTKSSPILAERPMVCQNCHKPLIPGEAFYAKSEWGIDGLKHVKCS